MTPYLHPPHVPSEKHRNKRTLAPASFDPSPQPGRDGIVSALRNIKQSFRSSRKQVENCPRRCVTKLFDRLSTLLIDLPWRDVQPEVDKRGSGPGALHAVAKNMRKAIAQASQSLRVKNERERERFPVLRRKRTLSFDGGINGDEDGEGKETENVSARDNVKLKSKEMQWQSPFFAKLPPEIRELVYGFVMGGRETIHFTGPGKSRKFKHFLCEGHINEERKSGGSERMCTCTVLVGGRRTRKLEAGVLELLCVCRRIYTEAIPHLYTPHTFALLHITHLLYLPSILPTPRLNQIRTLRLKWSIRGLPFLRRKNDKPGRYAYHEDTLNWIQGWETLANMQRLRDLRVVVVDSSPGNSWETQWLELEGLLLENVKGVKQTRWFEVMLPYWRCVVERDMGGCGVVLRRPGEGGAAGGFC